MKKLTLFICVIFLTVTAYSQGHETFDDFDEPGSSYETGTFTGQDGSTWDYVKARGDAAAEINNGDKALMLGRNQSPDAELTSGTLENGIGTLSFTYMQAFGSDVDLEVYVNNNLVYTATSDSQEGEALVTDDIVVDVGGDFVLKFSNPSGGQVSIDDVIWTAYDDFPSPYCDIDESGVTIEEITAVDFGGTNIENDNTTDVLINKTDTVIDVLTGGTYTLEVEGNTSGDFENDIVAFIDWNQNELFDESDAEVYEVGTLKNSTGDDGTSVSLQITVPDDAVLGTTRIRITKTFTDEEGEGGGPPSPALINPCAIEFDAFEMGAQPGYGQALDFTLNIEESEECEAPTNLEVVDVTDTTAEVIWTAGEDETMWTVIYGLSGFTQEDEDDYETEVVFETNYTITDLEPETDYDVYVVAVCDAQNMIVSDQVGPFTFTTDELSVKDHNFENFTFYPNPVQNQLNLKAGEQIESVTVHNLLGQKVIDVNPNTVQTQVDVDHLSAGVYLMNVTVNGTQKSFRIVKK